MAKNQNVSLDDKYDLAKPLVFLSGTQAIGRLTLMQKERDRQANLNPNYQTLVRQAILWAAGRLN